MDADTNSESNVPLSSEESDDSVSDGDIVNPAAMVDEPGRVKAKEAKVKVFAFPAAALARLMDGLNKLPTWTVYPSKLAECIRATTLILHQKLETQAAVVSDVEEGLMRRLVRETLSQAFAKCLDDGAVLAWPGDTQVEIYAALLSLAELAAQELKVLSAAKTEDEIADAEEEVACVLNELTLAFDPRCSFNVKNASERGLKTTNTPPEPRFAHPLEDADATPPGWEAEHDQPGQLHQWLAGLIDHFGGSGGFDLICEVLSQPDRYSVALLDLLLGPLVKAEELLVPASLAPVAEKLQGLLDYVEGKLAQDLEALSDKGRDRMFVCASSLLEKTNVLLSKCLGEAGADAAVGKVQRRFIVQLLSQSSFSKHLGAVRETNNLLMRALALRDADDGNSVKVNVEWMRENDVVKHLLRANLHQKQYVDQVQKVLKNLTIEGGLQEDHLDLLWNLTEKVDTFETVKNNVYDMLGALAQDFNPQQLDALFSKFEACSGGQDATKIMDLMRRLAKSDTKGVMAKRVMSLLWSLMMNPEAPSEVSRSPAITDALQAYADRKGLVDAEITYEYMRQCVIQIQAGTSVLAAMSLLQRLVTTGQEGHFSEGNQALRMLEKDFGVVDVVLTSLEDFQSRERAALEAGQQLDVAAHEEVIREYGSFLLNVPAGGRIQLSWPQAERIWGLLVGAPVLPSDRDLGLQLMYYQAQQHLLPSDALASLLREKLVGVDIASLQPREAVHFWVLFSAAFRIVAVAEKKMLLPPEESPLLPPQITDLNLTGLPALWRLVLDSDDGVIANGQQYLVALYTALSEDLQREVKGVRTLFLQTCLGELLPAAKLLTGCEVDAPSCKPLLGGLPKAGDQEAAARRAARCLALLQDLVTQCQGRTMPSKLMHGASFQGPPARFEVQTTTSRQQPNRFRAMCHGNMYIGQLRRNVALKLAAQPENVRLFAFGKELINDARLIKEEAILDGTTIMAAISPHANSYTRITPQQAQEAEAASPACLLAQSPWLYDVLLALAEARNYPPVRCNAMQLLDAIPTDARLLTQLSAALGSSNAVPELASLLCGPEREPKPARLLYTLQALTSQLFPVAGNEDAATSAQEAFVQSGCVAALLLAMRSIDDGNPADVDAIRSLHWTAQLLLTRLQAAVAKAEPPDVAMQDAPPDPGTGTQEAGQGARPISPTAAVTVTLEADGKPGGGPPDIPAEVVLFHLSLAAKSGRGWRAASPHPDTSAEGLSGQEGLLEQDALINQEALVALKQLLEMQPRLLAVLLTNPRHQQALERALLEGLLNKGHEAVRASAFRFGERLAKLGSCGEGHLHLLRLLCNLACADAAPGHSGEYYRLLCELIRSIPNTPQQVRKQELQIAQALLDELVAASPDLAAADEEDARLEGKLCLLLELVGVLDRRQVGSPGSGGLVRLILTDFLFPESWFLAHLAGGRRLLEVPLGDVARALQARCATKASRLAALNLLYDLMTHHSGNLREGMELIGSMHLDCDIIEDNKSNYSPKFQLRRPGAFVGLRNAGATCYMNSVFQQLFMQPSIRRLLLSSPEVAEAERPDSVFYQLQSVFANLALANRDSHMPRPFWKAFKDYDGEPINVREHQDAYEFFTRLQDLVDQHMRDAKQKPAMQLVMGGKFAQQIICRSVQFRSEKEEDFYQISLDVRGKRTLEESLDFYVQGELMEGDNQYLCEELGRKVDAVKRNCIKVLPHMLVVHLKRFEYDYETMNRWKIKDRFEFPQELNMYKYTVAGLEEGEADISGMSTASDGAAAASPRDQQQYQYHLKGIVVHSGTAFAGHYYSYIKVRGEGGQHVGTAGQWFCFDDNSVEPWDVANLDADCFGGKYVVDVQEPLLPGPKEYDRPNSAYMLFYERAESLEPVSLLDAREETASMRMATSPASSRPMPASPSQATALADEAASNLATVPIPDIAASVPSLYADILEGNLKLVQELRLLDRDYFKSVLRLAKDAAEDPFRPPSNMRRTEPSPPPAGPSSGDSREASPVLTRREADTDQAAERLVNFAGQFLLRVFLRSNSILREDQGAWEQLLLGLLEANAAANSWFLRLFFVEPDAQDAPSADNDILESFLVWSHPEDVSAFVAHLLIAALRNATERHGGVVTRFLRAADTGSSAWAVHNVITVMLRILRQGDMLRPNCSPLQFCTVLKEYALIGPAQREHLHVLRFPEAIVHTLDMCEDRSKQPEMLLLMEVLTMLLLSMDFSGALGAPPGETNPYAVAEPHLYEGDKELLSSLLKGAPAELMFMTHMLLQNEALQKLMEFLLWNNEHLTMEWLQKVPILARKLNADQLNKYGPVIVKLTAIRDKWRMDRVRMVLLDRQQPGRECGLLVLVSDTTSPPSMHPVKRFQIIRLVLLLIMEAPEVYTRLQGLDAWVGMYDWLDKMQEDGAAVCNQQDFQLVYRLLQNLITTGHLTQQSVEVSEEDPEVQELQEEEVEEEDSSEARTRNSTDSS